VPIRGPRPNTKFIGESLGSDTLSASGYVKVQPSLQLFGHPNIFSAGDVIDWQEEKQAVKVMSQAPIAANNIAAVLSGNTAALKQYKGSSEMIVVTNGKVRCFHSYTDVVLGLTQFFFLVERRCYVFGGVVGSHIR